MDSQEIGVYRIVSPSGSCYVGMTTLGFSIRWKNHLKDFRGGRTKCSGLRSAFQKYGIANMRMEILEEFPVATPDEMILQAEKRWWLYLKENGVNLYNGEPSGTGSVRHTEETRKRISEGTIKSPILLMTCANEKCKVRFETKRKTRVFCSSVCFRENQELRNGVSKDELIRLHINEGLSIGELGQLVGTSPEAVSKRLRGYGVKIRRANAKK